MRRQRGAREREQNFGNVAAGPGSDKNIQIIAADVQQSADRLRIRGNARETKKPDSCMAIGVVS